MITLTENQIEDLVRSHIEATLTPGAIDAIAEEYIRERIAMLTLEQAAKHLQCANVRQLVDFCRLNNIPIRHFGRKKRFILVSDIEAAQSRVAVRVGSGQTTKIGKSK